MIASLRGLVASKGGGQLVLEVSGVGYQIFATPATLARLPAPGQSACLLIEESFGLYGGGASLYGFSDPAERSMFLAFKDQVPATGAKKALEYLDKASKSLPDFRRAVLEKDAKLLCGVFGFTKKTADKLIAALKDKMEETHVPGREKLARAGEPGSGALSQALNALSALGYKSAEARGALELVAEETAGKKLPVEDILRLALKKL